jgi:Zn-finger protein
MENLIYGGKGEAIGMAIFPSIRLHYFWNCFHRRCTFCFIPCYPCVAFGKKAVTIYINPRTKAIRENEPH